MGLTREDLVALARSSFTGSFLAPEEIARHLADIDRYLASQPATASSAMTTAQPRFAAY